MKVTVKIAVAVDPDGNWDSYGWHKSEQDKPEHAMELAADGCEDCATYWIEAELDVPPRRMV
jgi:hypothetical protein